MARTYFEVGVFAGQSLALWHDTTARLDVRTRSFAADSFQGLPASVEQDEGPWREGDYACSLASTKAELRPERNTTRGIGVERAFNEWHERNPNWTVEEMGTYDLERNGRWFKAGRVLRLERTR